MYITWPYYTRVFTENIGLIAECENAFYSYLLHTTTNMQSSWI